jgi:hypothetical protein
MNKTILICRGNTETPKSYPYWSTLLPLFKDYEIKEITGILSEDEIIQLVNDCILWISIDSFISHLCAYKKLKSGVVIWGLSDPLIFGYPHNINILKDRKYLRPDQWRWWRDVPYQKEAFLEPEKVFEIIQEHLSKIPQISS